jgi:nitrous oxide reductase accessory protein NosL
MVLWLKDKKMSDLKLWVYTNDSHRWIEAKDAYFSVDEVTPMRHGFGAYEHKKDEFIEYDEVKNRVLRGEDLTNPIIRKKILGL